MRPGTRASPKAGPPPQVAHVSLGRVSGHLLSWHRLPEVQERDFPRPFSNQPSFSGAATEGPLAHQVEMPTRRTHLET